MIPVFKPTMGEEESKAVADVLMSGWIGLGPKTAEFEKQFAAYIGTAYAVAVNSATAALHLAMKVMEVEGGEVISTPMTFVSTNHAILYNRAAPVFCDIEPDTLNIDASRIEALITPQTRAIMVVHYGGYSADMETVLQVARSYGLKVIEDAAHGCGGEWCGRKLGSIGDIGCFSFQAVKNLATGDGGMIVTNDEEIYERLLRLRWVGINRDTWSRDAGSDRGYSWYYNVDELGFKYHMNDIAAAIGLVQLSKLDCMNARRREISDCYSRAFQEIEGMETPAVKRYMTRPACHNYVIKYPDRDGLNAHLKSCGVSTGVHYIPNNHYEMYRNCRGETPVCERVWKNLLTLPLYPDLNADELGLIIDEVKSYATVGVHG
jgi:perosamine synthetase